MTAFFWMAKKWSQWMLVFLGGLVGVVVLAEGVEQARFLPRVGLGWSLLVGIAAKLPLLVRDLWTPLMALASGLFVCHYRDNALRSFSLSGCRPAAFFTQMSFLTLIASGLVLGAVELTLAHQKPDLGQSEWVFVDGLATRLQSQPSGAVEVLQLQRTSTGMEVNRAVDLDPAVAQVLISGANPAQAALSQLVEHPHPLAKAWWVWRLCSWVLPSILVFLVASLCWILPLPLGVLSALSLGLGVATQMCGSSLAQMGLNPVFLVVFLSLSVATLLGWKSHRGGLGP
jgi:hypothetical protein